MPKVESWLVIPDLHFPFECRLYIKLILKITAILKEDASFRGVCQLGDFVDWFQLSRFDFNPSRINDAFDDLVQYSGFIDQMSAVLPRGTTWLQCTGNHEQRLQKYIWAKAPKIQQMIISLNDMLKFPERNKQGKVKYKLYPYDSWDALKIGDTVLTHGYFYNQHVAMGNMIRYGVKTISGHTHRFQFVSNGNIFACSLGHGSDESKTAHQPTPTGWQQAFAVLHNVSGKCHLEAVLVNHGKCLFRGEVISG